MEPSLSALRAFVAVAERLHYGRAAEQLRVSPPALSQQISRLSEGVGTPLFHRVGRRVILTRAGEELLPLARQVVDSHRQVMAWADRSATGVVHVGFTTVGPTEFTAALFAAVTEQLAHVRIELHHAQRDAVARRVADGALDVGFLWGPVTANGLETRVLTMERRVALLHDDIDLRGQPQLELAHLGGIGMVGAKSLDDTYAAWTVADPRPDGSRALVRVRAGSIEETLALIAGAPLAAFVPQCVADGYRHPRVVQHAVADLTAAEFSVVIAQGDHREPVRSFVEVAERIGRTE